MLSVLRQVTFSLLDPARLRALFPLVALTLALALAPLATAQVPPALIAAFEEADAGLNEAYQAARAVMPEAAFLELRDTQRAWIAYRDDQAAHHARFNRGFMDETDQAESWPEFWESRTAITDSRTAYLRGYEQAYDGTFTGLPHWEGTWIDSFGGILEVVQLSESELGFKIDVVRGPTAHTGRITGIADISGDLARFAIWIVDIEAEAEVLLHRGEASIEIATNGATNWFHGMRAYFDGNYVRVAGLGDERQRLVDEVSTGYDDVMPLHEHLAAEAEKLTFQRNLRTHPELFVEAIMVGDAELVAAALGMPEAARWLAERDEYGRTPLFHAVSLGLHPEEVIRASDVNARALNGETALMLAVARPRVDVTRLLLEQGANIDAVDRLGQTALVHALRSSNTAMLDTVQALLAAGADPLRTDQRGRTAHDYALETGDRALAELVRDFHNLHVYAAHAKRLIAASGLPLRDIILHCPHGTSRPGCGLVYLQDNLERSTVTITCAPLLASLHTHGDYQGVISNDPDTYARYETVLRFDGHVPPEYVLAVENTPREEGLLVLRSGMRSQPLSPQRRTVADYCAG